MNDAETQAYIAQVQAYLNSPPSAPASTTPLGPAPAPMFGLPGAPAPIQAAPPPPPPPPPPPAPDPNADEARQMSVAGPNMSQGPLPPPAPPSPPAVPMGGPRSGGNEYPLLAVSRPGVVPAHELERRGPTLRAAQSTLNEVTGETIANVRERNQQAAQDEYALALDQERAARAREAALQQSIAERDEEMAQRQADFDGTVKQLGRLGTIDRDRFWASRSTGQKIAGFIEMALAGFNRAPSLIQKRIDDDVKAQEFAYYASRDTANAKQTAFAQMMQKYQNADAARAAARAGAIDTVQAQLAQLGSKWKGTEAANRADAAFAELQNQKVAQIANGIQFVPAQNAGRRFIDPRTGLIYTEAEAKALSAKVDERDFENRKQTAGIGGQLALEEAKAINELTKAQAGKADEGAHQISNQLQQAGVPQARAAAEQALAALNKSPGGTVDATARKVLGEGELANKLMPDDSNAREQAYWAFANAAMKAMMGNVTEGEMARAQKQLGSASDPESRRRAINSTLATLEEVEKNAKAGASPAAQAEFDRRRETAKGDKPAAPPSANKGW